jgi:hypothetical protein
MLVAGLLMSMSQETSQRKNTMVRKTYIDQFEVSVLCGKYTEWFQDYEMKITVFGGGSQQLNDAFISQVSEPANDQYHTQTLVNSQTIQQSMNPMITFSNPIHKCDEKKLASLFNLTYPTAPASVAPAPEVWHDWYNFGSFDANNDGSNEQVIFYSSAFSVCSISYQGRSYRDYLYSPYLALVGTGRRYHAKIEKLRYDNSKPTSIETTYFVVNYFDEFQILPFDSLNQNARSSFTN